MCPQTTGGAAEAPGMRKPKLRVLAICVIAVFIALIAFTTCHQVWSTFVAVHQTVSSVKYVVPGEEYPPATIGILSFNPSYEAVNGSDYFDSFEDVFEWCSLEERRSYFNNTLAAWGPKFKYRGRYSTSLFFPAHRKWQRGYSVVLTCFDNWVPPLNEFYLVIVPDSFENFVKLLSSRDFDYDYQEESSMAEVVVRNYPSARPTLLSDLARTQVMMQRQEIYDEGVLKELAISYKVHLANYQAEPGLLLLSVTFEWEEGRVMRTDRFRNGDYLSLAILFCTVTLALERTVAFVLRAKRL